MLILYSMVPLLCGFESRWLESHDNDTSPTNPREVVVDDCPVALWPSYA